MSHWRTYCESWLQISNRIVDGFGCSIQNDAHFQDSLRHLVCIRLPPPPASMLCDYIHAAGFQQVLLQTAKGQLQVLRLGNILDFSVGY